MKGRRTWRGFMSNWARMALPKVSAVMPVPSETKNTVRERSPFWMLLRQRVDTGKEMASPVSRQSRESVPVAAQAYNCHAQFSPCPRRPTTTTTKPRRPCMAACQAIQGRKRPGFNWSFPMSSTLFQPDRPGRTV